MTISSGDKGRPSSRKLSTATQRPALKCHRVSSAACNVDYNGQQFSREVEDRHVAHLPVRIVILDGQKRFFEVVIRLPVTSLDNNANDNYDVEKHISYSEILETEYSEIKQRKKNILKTIIKIYI